MNITFVSADDTIRMTFGIDPWSAVTDLTKIEKELGKDLTDIIQKAIDVAFNVTSQTFTRGPKDAYIVSYSWELQPIIGGHITKDNAVESISVTVGDSDHSLYEFEDVEDRDIDAMITWLRKEHQVYYTPNDELLNEKKKWAEKVAKQQKKIDSYEATLSKITDIMKPEYAGPAWSETWDDLVERIKRMKEHAEMLEAAKTDWRDSFEKAQDSRSAFCKKLKEKLNVDYRYPSYFPKMEEDILAEVTRLKAEHIELEEKLKHAAEVEVWYRRTNRELVMERDTYRDTCEELKQDINEWQDWFDSICEELDTPARDFATVLNELRKNLNELDKLAEYKAKLAEIIRLPEDKKGTATTEDYISCFEHTKKEWRRMEIKLENYERENRLLNTWLEDRKKKLDDILPDYANAKCARAELRYLYSKIVGFAARDDMSLHEMAVCIHSKYKHTFHKGARYCDRMRELEQKLEDIRDICDGNSDVMNIIGE